jgi:hypothetical protein
MRCQNKSNEVPEKAEKGLMVTGFPPGLLVAGGLLALLLLTVIPWFSLARLDSEAVCCLIRVSCTQPANCVGGPFGGFDGRIPDVEDVDPPIFLARISLEAAEKNRARSLVTNNAESAFSKSAYIKYILRTAAESTLDLFPNFRPARKSV